MHLDQYLCLCKSHVSSAPLTEVQQYSTSNIGEAIEVHDRVVFNMMGQFMGHIGPISG